MASPANKIGMFLLQILNETDTAPVAATAVAHVRSVRAKVEVERAVATALCGRPIAAVALHIVHIGAAAVTRSGQEDCTYGF